MSSAVSDPGLWGHEYIRRSTAELETEYLARKEEKEADENEERAGTIDDLYAFANECAKFLLLHNAEADYGEVRNRGPLSGTCRR